jgi:hypothetical protein
LFFLTRIYFLTFYHLFLIEKFYELKFQQFLVFIKFLRVLSRFWLFNDFWSWSWVFENARNHRALVLWRLKWLFYDFLWLFWLFNFLDIFLCIMHDTHLFWLLNDLLFWGHFNNLFNWNIFSLLYDLLLYLLFNILFLNYLLFNHFFFFYWL